MSVLRMRKTGAQPAGDTDNTVVEPDTHLVGGEDNGDFHAGGNLDLDEGTVLAGYEEPGADGGQQGLEQHDFGEQGRASPGETPQKKGGKLKWVLILALGVFGCFGLALFQQMHANSGAMVAPKVPAYQPPGPQQVVPAQVAATPQPNGMTQPVPAGFAPMTTPPADGAQAQSGVQQPSATAAVPAQPGVVMPQPQPATSAAQPVGPLPDAGQGSTVIRAGDGITVRTIPPDPQQQNVPLASAGVATTSQAPMQPGQLSAPPAQAPAAMQPQPAMAQVQGPTAAMPAAPTMPAAPAQNAAMPALPTQSDVGTQLLAKFDSMLTLENRVLDILSQRQADTQSDSQVQSANAVVAAVNTKNKQLTQENADLRRRLAAAEQRQKDAEAKATAADKRPALPGWEVAGLAPQFAALTNPAGKTVVVQVGGEIANGITLVSVDIKAQTIHTSAGDMAMSSK